MANLIVFKPRSMVNAAQNLDDFITHCRDKLTLYEDQGGFNSDKWHFDCGRKKHAMVFSCYTQDNNPYAIVPMEEPFKSFAKAYIRYKQSERQVTSVGDKMVTVKTLHDALCNVYSDVNVIKTDGLVQDEIVTLLNARYPKSDKLFRFGGQLEILFEFLSQKGIAPNLPDWRNPWKRPKSKAEGTDDESREWQAERCPSQHQMLALADVFARATTPQDLYWSSVIALLMFAPSRGSELSHLTIHSLHEDEGRLGVRWFSQKGFDFTIKWVPTCLENMVRQAFERLLTIGQPARDAAKFAFENPGRFFRHPKCITPEMFPENKPLNALEFAHAMDFSALTIQRLKDKTKQYDSITAWNMLGAHQVKWIMAIRENGNPNYSQLAQKVLNDYATEHWPNLPKMNRPVWEALLLIRDNEFHAEHQPKSFSWIMPDVNQLNDQLNQRPLKNPIPTIFQRFGIKDEDGSEIKMTSHQMRVWLSTNAERGGMDSWRLAQWAGRARIEDNKHYDLRTQEERDAQVNALLQLEHRPTALEAIKLNQPVAYVDLGLNRIGIADVTEYGFCVHDYAMSPCTKGGECMTCKEHVCMKGMPKTLDRIKQLEEQIESQYQKAISDHQQEVFGADRWETHLGWKLAHIRTQRIRLESDETPDGTLLWIPPAHDPSPVERSLQQRGYQTNTPENELFSAASIAELLGLPNA